MNKDSRAYIIKLLEQNIIKTPKGVFFSLDEPLKWFGSNNKLVHVAIGNFSDDVMAVVRRNAMTQYGKESIAFCLDRVPIMDYASDAANPKPLMNQMDPKVSHTYNIQGRLAHVLGSIRYDLLMATNPDHPVGRNATFTVTIDP